MVTWQFHTTIEANKPYFHRLEYEQMRHILQLLFLETALFMSQGQGDECTKMFNFLACLEHHPPDHQL